MKVRVHKDDVYAVPTLVDALRSMLPTDRPVVYLCIGTDRNTGDAFGPLVGTFLSDSGLDVLGTVHDPVHAVNLSDTIARLQRRTPKPFIVPIDAALGESHHVGTICVWPGAMKPGGGVGRELPEVGNVSISGCVNVGGFMEYFVLSSTRLSFVWDLARVTADAILEHEAARCAGSQVIYA